jgi:hypothetical protein
MMNIKNLITIVLTLIFAFASIFLIIYTFVMFSKVEDTPKLLLVVASISAFSALSNLIIIILNNTKRREETEDQK